MKQDENEQNHKNESTSVVDKQPNGKSRLNMNTPNNNTSDGAGDSYIHMNECTFVPNKKYEAQATHNKNSPAYQLHLKMNPMVAALGMTIEFPISFRTNEQGKPFDIQDLAFGTGQSHPDDIDVKLAKTVN